MRGVAGLLASAPRPVAVEAILQALEALGRARVVNGLWTLGWTAAFPVREELTMDRA